MSEFSWWLLIIGIVIGGGLAWLVLADSTRRDVDETERELPLESAWIASSLVDDGVTLDEQTIEQVLRLHRAYLAAPPPDNLPEDEDLGWDEGEGVDEGKAVDEGEGVDDDRNVAGAAIGVASGDASVEPASPTEDPPGVAR